MYQSVGYNSVANFMKLKSHKMNGLNKMGNYILQGYFDDLKIP